MIKPLNPHYAMENPASVYDEEALTALELAGRTAGKVNEVVKEVNEFTENMEKKHTELVESVPGLVADDVQKHIESGEFDRQIEEHIGELDERLNNLIVNGEENLTEVVDLRVGAQGFTFDNAGNAVREQFEQALLSDSGNLKFYRGSIDSEGGEMYQKPQNRCVSNLFAIGNITMIKARPSSYKFKVFGYGSDGSYNGCTDWVTEYNFLDEANPIGSFARIVIRRDDDQNFEDPSIVPLDILNNANIGCNELVRIKPLPFINGTVTSDGEITYRDNRLVSPLIPATDYVIPSMDFIFALVACYDGDLNFLGCTEFTNKTTEYGDLIQPVEYVRIVLRIQDNLPVDPSITTEPVVIYMQKSAPMIHEEWDKGAPAFLHETMDIAYSDVHLAPINTLLHYRCASHMDFNAIKGDVRRTANGVLIMSHDAGFTRKGDTSELLDYDPENCTLWSDYEWDEVFRLGYTNDVGYAEALQYVPEFRHYLWVCRERNKIAYITLREDPSIVEEVLNIIKEYGMEDRCVINSYTYRTLETVRKFSRTIPVSLVLDKGTPLNMNHVTKVKNLGNGIVTLFYYPDTDSVTGLSLLKSTEEVIKTALNSGVVVHMAQLNSTHDYKRCIQYGISGAHITRCVLPHTPKMYTMECEIVQGTCNVGGNWNLQDITTATVGDLADQGVYYVNITSTVLKQLLDKNMCYVGVHCPNNAAAVAYYKEGAVYIETHDIEGWYRIIIIV